MRTLISYPLRTTDRGWPGAPTLAVRPHESMAKGDVLNTYVLELFNHFGSHMDAPRHFNGAGPCLHEYPVDAFFFDAPLLLDIPKDFREKVEPRDLEPHAAAIAKADLLLIRSGFSRWRASDNVRYAAEGPAVGSAAARMLSERFPGLGAIALDWISLASAADGSDGVLAHQHLLGFFGGNQIRIIEDLDFSRLDAARLERVIALPLWVEGIDSAPVTVVAESR